MTRTEKFEGETFEADLRAGMAPVPASADLKREILLLPLEYPRLSSRRPGTSDESTGRMAATRLPWYAKAWTPMSLSTFAAAASLILGIYVGIGGFLGQAQGADEVDLAGLAYDPSGSLGDL